MPLKASTKEELPAVNLTPMIDVVFLLIVFFMVGTQFSDSEEQIAVNLPGVGKVNAMISAPERREIVVAADGSAFLDGRPVSVEQLRSMLVEMRDRYPDLAVAVRADADAKHGSVVAVYFAINQAGVTNMSVLGTRVAGQPSNQQPYR